MLWLLILGYGALFFWVLGPDSVVIGTVFGSVIIAYAYVLVGLWTSLPLTYTVRLLRGVWFGGPWRDHWLEVMVLGGVMLVSAALAARFFRWE